MRLPLALLAVLTMVSLAAPAHADPGGNDAASDADFLATLRQFGVTYSLPDQAIGVAQAMCTSLENGESGLKAIRDVMAYNPGLNMDDASNFAVIAAKYYCPQQLYE